MDESTYASGSDSLIDSVADWLMTQALATTSADQLLEECSLRLNAAGVPLWRSNLAFQILHPLYHAVGFTWYREGGLQPIERFEAHELDQDRWQRSPLHYIVENKLPFIRRRLAGPEAQFDFPLLKDFRDDGATDYLGYLVSFGDIDEMPGDHRNGMVGSWTTDRPGGFSEDDIRALLRIQRRLGVACKMDIKEKLTENVLAAYLGPDAGRQVLAGQIKLGDGDTIHAVIWYSDLRNSTALADALPPAEFLTVINGYFSCTAGAVLAHEGEVLRFIGDAVLAIFPIRDGAESEKEACEKALAAAADATSRLKILNRHRKSDKAAPLAFGLGLHVGDVMYGNIGVPERIEFSVVGPAANEVARLENLTKSLARAVLVSDRFASALDMKWESLGDHQLAGVGAPMEVFALPAASLPAASLPGASLPAT